MAGALMMAQMSWHSAETELLSPTNLGADVWVDFSDPTSYTTVGSTITAVTDKASNFTLTVNGTPTTGTTLNSLATGTFDGNESLISTGTGPYADSGNHYAIGIFQWASTTSTRDSFWSADGSRTYAVSSSNSSNSWPGEIDYDGSNSISSGKAKQDFTVSVSQNTWTIVSTSFNKTGNEIFGRINGSQASAGDPYSLSMNTTADFRLMRNRASVELAGKAAEFFWVAGPTGTGGTDISNVEKAEGYIAWKWGLQGNLPVSHPYKNAAPTT